MLEPATNDPILEWYQRLYGEAEDGWLSFFSIDRRNGETLIDWCKVTDLERAAEITRKLSVHGDVWNGVAIRTHRTSGRGGADECGWVTALWADIDFKDAGHQGNDRLPPDVEAATEIVKAFPVRPTALTHTGGGLQAWYWLDEVVPVAELGDLLESFGATWAKVGADLGYHVDNVFDLARIMRPVGSFNRKLETARPITLTGAKWERRYGVSELRDACIDPPVVTIDRKKNDVPYIGPDRPGDDFTNRHDGHELLTAEGFHSPKQLSNGDTYYWAPHRDRKRDQHGAVVYDDGHITVYSDTFCASRPALKIQHGYDPFGFYVAVKHGGDFSAATKALRSEGYGAPMPAKGDPFGRDEMPRIPPPTVDPETGEIDDAPVPLDNHLHDLPEFPMHVLPAWMADEAKAAADAIQVPVEMTAFLGLMALSICVAGKVDVDAINWRQPLNLYGAIVAPTGTGKSPAAERMLAPIRELEENLAAANADAVAYSEAEATSLASAIAEAEKALKATPGSVSLISQLADARATANEHRVLSPYRMTVDDHTPEALSLTIASQVDERVAVVSPEGAALFESMTGKRYKDASAIPNVPDVYLKSWGGEQISVDRVGRAPLTIKRPILTVCVMVQPDIITSLSASPMIARQGGLARFLWVAAKDIVGTRDRGRRRHAPPPSTEYRDNLVRLGLWAAGCEQGANVIHATEEAADVVDDLANERERRMGFGGDLEAHRAIEAKMLAYHWRLAGLLAVAHDDRGQLTADRARQATELVDYFMAHAVAVHATAGLAEGASTLRTVAAYLTRHAGEDIDWRDFGLAMRGVVDNSVSELVPTLEQLVAMRWLKVTDGDLSTVGVKGARNPTVTVNAQTRAFFRGA